MANSNHCWLGRLAEEIEAPLTDHQQLLIDRAMRRISRELQHSLPDRPASSQREIPTAILDDTRGETP